MKDVKIKKRYLMGRKECMKIREAMVAPYSPEVEPSEKLEHGTGDGNEYILEDAIVVAMIDEGDLMLTIRGVMKYRPARKYVTVDMGAIRFVTNGADIMSPGIIDADPEIAIGDPVWIRDEKNRTPLAVGRAILPGAEMVDSSTGKAIRNINYVGDPLWNLDLSKK